MKTQFNNNQNHQLDSKDSINRYFTSEPKVKNTIVKLNVKTTSFREIATAYFS